jgi:copper chaperone CopZ
VREALETLPWVKQVRVDYSRKQATFIAETDKYDEKAIIQALEQAGFGGKMVQ